MRFNIPDIKKINTCGYLRLNDWNYESEASSSPFIIGMKEVLRWHYKRSNPVDTQSFMAFFSRLNTKLKLDIDKKVAIEQAFNKFINSDYYCNLTHVFMGYETDIKINKVDVLEHRVPVLVKQPDKRPVFIYYEDGCPGSNKMFLNRYEVMHNAVWSFYCLNKEPTFTRLWFDGEEIRRENIRVDDKYILKAKKLLIKLGQNTDNFIIPPIQICEGCSKIDVCERFDFKV